MVRNPILLYNSGSLPVSRNATTARWSNHGDTVRVEKAQRMVVAAMHVRQNRQVLIAASFATGASLVLLAILNVAFPGLQRSELDSTAGFR